MGGTAGRASGLTRKTRLGHGQRRSRPDRIRIFVASIVPGHLFKQRQAGAAATAAAVDENRNHGSHDEPQADQVHRRLRAARRDR